MRRWKRTPTASSQKLQDPPLEAVFDVLAVLSDIVDIHRMQIQKTPVARDIETHAAGRQGDQVGKQGDLCVAARLQRYRQDAGPGARPWCQYIIGYPKVGGDQLPQVKNRKTKRMVDAPEIIGRSHERLRD